MDSDERKRSQRSQRNHGKTLRFFLTPLKALHRLLGALFKKALGGDYSGVTEDEILSMVDAGNESGLFEDASVEMINNVFEFDDLLVEDVMTHRVNIVGIDVNGGLDEIIYLALDEGFSRIPVYEGGIDKIIGIVIVKDLLCLIGNDNYKNSGIRDFLRDVLYIPASCGCADAFKLLNKKKSGMAVVVDEYGGTAGILTLEDLVEAIVGSIEDEYDDESDEIRIIGKGKYEVDGEADPDEVLELFGYELPDDHEYDTVAGFVTDLLGYIPDGEDIQPHADYKDIRFVVKEARDSRILKIVVFGKND